MPWTGSHLLDEQHLRLGLREGSLREGSRLIPILEHPVIAENGTLHRASGIRLELPLDEIGRVRFDGTVGPLTRRASIPFEGGLVLHRKQRNSMIYLSIVGNDHRFDILKLGSAGIERISGHDSESERYHSMISCDENWAICEEE